MQNKRKQEVLGWLLVFCAMGVMGVTSNGYSQICCAVSIFLSACIAEDAVNNDK